MESTPKLLVLRNGALLVTLTWLLVASAYRGAVSADGGITGVDFRVFYEAAARLNAGVPLYQTDHLLYVYSPLLAMLLRPLARLPFETALRVWFFVSAGSLALSMFLFARAAHLGWRDAVPVGLMLIVGFRFWPATMNFGLGQANFVLLALVAGMYWADSRRKMGLLALLIAAAALVKVWALGLLLYLLLRRQWKPALIGLGGFAAGMAVLFSLTGWREWPQFVEAGKVSARHTDQFQVTQSLVGFAHLHFRDNTLVHPLVLSAALAGGFVLAGTAALAAGMAFLWRLGPAGSPYQDRLRFGLVILSVLLLLPPFEGEYLVYCLPLLWTLLTYTGADAGRRQEWLLAAGLAAYLVLARGWPEYPPLAEAYRHGPRSLLVSMDFFGAAALWLVALAALRGSTRRSCPQVSDAGSTRRSCPHVSDAAAPAAAGGVS